MKTNNHEYEKKTAPRPAAERIPPPPRLAQFYRIGVGDVIEVAENFAVLDFRREGQTIWYRIAEPRTELLLGYLQKLFCPDD